MSQYLNLEERLYQGVGKYDIPQIDPVQECDVDNWIGFNYAKSTRLNPARTGVQFFLDDYQFDRVWNSPSTYVKILSKYKVCLSPDWSLYTDFPKAVQIFNHYRKHWVARYWQEHGITVIPTIAWSDEESFNWCFDGEPVGGIVAVSNVGCMKNKECEKLFNIGYQKMLDKLKPSKVLMFAYKFSNYEGPVTYIRYHIAKGNGVY